MHLARTVTKRYWSAAFVTLLVAVGPLWGILSVGFMTDVPAFALTMGVAALAARTLTATHNVARLQVLVLAFGLAAFTVREYTAIIVVAFTIVQVLVLRSSGRRAELRSLLLSVTVVVVGALAFLALWRTIPDAKGLVPKFPNGHSIRGLAYKGTGLVRLCGLLLLPALLYANPVAIVQRAWRTARDTTVFATFFVSVALAFTSMQAPRLAFAGNYIVPDGALAQGVGSGHRPDVWSPSLFNTLALLGSIGTALLALCLVPALTEFARWARTRTFEVRSPAVAMLGLAIFGYSAVYTVAAFTGLPLYDRYILPVLPFAGILVVRLRDAPAAVTDRGDVRSRTGGLHTPFALLTLVLLWGFGLTAVADSASYDGVRWNVARAAVRAGYVPRDIGGNFEWVNYFSDDPGTGVRLRERPCVKVSLGPHKPGLAVIARGTYRPPFQEPVPVYAVRLPIACRFSVPKS